MSAATHPNVSKEFIVMMAALISIVAISIDAMLPALGLIGVDLKATNANQPQLIVGFIFIGMTIGQLINGPLSDAIGRRKILFAGIGIYLFGSVICMISQSMEIMLLGRILQGFGVSGPYIASQSIVRDKYSGRAMARIMSLVMMIFIMVPTLAPALGQAVLFFGSWRYIFGLYIIYATSIFLWAYFRLDETLPIEKRRPFDFSHILNAAKIVVTTKATLLYTLATGCVFACLIGYISSVQQIYQTQYGVGELFALFFGAQALSSALSSLINSRLVERLGMRYIVLRTLICISILSAVFLTIQIIAGPAPLWMFFTYGTAVFFSIGLLFGNLNALAMEPMGDMAGIAAAIIGAISSVISITCGTIIGQLYNGTTIPLTAGFMLLTCAAIVFISCERSHKIR